MDKCPKQIEKLIFEKSSPGHKGYTLPAKTTPSVDAAKAIPAAFLRKDPPRLPQIGEVEVVRHYVRLSQLNYSVDNGFYPLGSCTMKYNPKINEAMSRVPGFNNLHPYQDESTVQGALQMMYELQTDLCEIAGMDAMTLQPAAGAHGELAGMKVIKAFLESKGETERNIVIVPDSAHGTNPATASMFGMEVLEIRSLENGEVDLDALRAACNEKTAALMLTNPNTLGLFESQIADIQKIVHQAGALLYYDGANANAIMGICRPGDMGFDVVHLNLHKTFATPHGGGGPGSGPIGVKARLAPFLPKPLVAYNEAEDRYYLDYDIPQSIGRMRTFYGNFGVLIKAYTYLRAIGASGVREVSEVAVLNANYLRVLMSEHYEIAKDRICKHEFIASPKRQNEHGVHGMDIAKRFLDYGFHPPTMYFPLIVDEAIMVEPTETETKDTLDAVAEAFAAIARECEENPEVVRNAPSCTVVGRPDEKEANKNQILRYEDFEF